MKIYYLGVRTGGRTDDLGCVLYSRAYLYPPQTLFGGGVYCFDVVLPSVRPSVRNTSNLKRDP